MPKENYLEVKDESIIRFALNTEYNGGPFIGWQRQASGLSIQEVLEKAASKLANGGKVKAFCAGRTDSGVHAYSQPVLLEMPAVFQKERLACKLREALNYHLKPYPISVLQVNFALPDWHPRFSAISRRYRYIILNRPAPPTLETGFVWHVCSPLDTGLMQQGADYLLGKHDFSSFRAASCQASSSIRTLNSLTVTHSGDKIFIDVEAKSFLHHQIRNFVGTLKKVGDLSKPPSWVKEVLEAKNRSAAGPTAPADGLFFQGVTYLPDPFYVHKAL